jgi:hypothetical protein
MSGSSTMAMAVEDQSKISSTSNAVEAAHALLLRGAGGEKFVFEAGLERLLDASLGFERKHHAAGM